MRFTSVRFALPRTRRGLSLESRRWRRFKPYSAKIGTSADNPPRFIRLAFEAAPIGTTGFPETNRREWQGNNSTRVCSERAPLCDVNWPRPRVAR